MVADLGVVLRLEPVREALTALERSGAVARLLARDPGLWTDDEAVAHTIRQRLGWLDAADPGHAPASGPAPAPSAWRGLVTDLAAAVTEDGLSHVVLAGMGGSSLAPEVFSLVFRGHVHGATLSVLDSTHPDTVRHALDEADLSRTLVVVASKSGGTEETACFAAHAAALVPSPTHLVAITDPGSALERQAVDDGWRVVLRNPPDIGGRFSALSLFGMAPAALLGVDVDAVWASAAELLRASGRGAPVAENPACQLAAFMGGFARAGRDKLTLLAPPDLAPLGDWIEQLVAESTGKGGVGVVPVVGEPPGAPDAYGGDRAFVAYRFGDVEPAGCRALAQAGHPVLFLDVADREDLGAEFVRWELATALAGALLGVNPFDEPNVTEAKEQTKAILAEVAGGQELPAPEHGDVAALVAGLRPGDYLAIHAYLPPRHDTMAAFTAARTALRDRLGVATTFGWGPRFLHSTGQLHKGGADNVAVLQVVDRALWERTGGPAIPGRPYDFGTLLRAQAAGDLRALRAHSRRATQVGTSGPEDVETLCRTLAAAADRA